MDLEFYSKGYEELKDKIIDRYNYWFLRYILMDISENGSVDYLIDDLSEFLYNIDLAIKLNNYLDDLIFENSDDVELTIKYLELKKITDRRILESPEYDESYVKESLFDITPENSVDKEMIKLNNQIKNKHEILELLGDFLLKEGYIDSIEIFSSHFEPSENWKTKINWTGGNLLSLVGLIEKLFVKNILPFHQKRKLRNKIILAHFKNENGDLKEGSIKTTATDVFQDNKFKKIKEFIDFLKVDFS